MPNAERRTTIHRMEHVISGLLVLFLNCLWFAWFVFELLSFSSAQFFLRYIDF